MKKKYSALFGVLLLSCFGFILSCGIVYYGGEVLLCIAVLFAIFVELWLIERRVIGYPRFHRKTLSQFGCIWHAICAILFVLFSGPVCFERSDCLYNGEISDVCYGVLAVIFLLRCFVVQPLYVSHCNRRKMFRG